MWGETDRLLETRERFDLGDQTFLLLLNARAGINLAAMENRGRQMRTALASARPPMTSAKEGIVEEFYRRRHIRYPLRVPVEFQRLRQDGKNEAAKAKSRDISEGGVYVFTKTLPPLGSDIELIMRLPVSQPGATPLALEMIGEVIRLETPAGRENQWGFAVCARKTVFRSPS